MEAETKTIYSLPKTRINRYTIILALLLISVTAIQCKHSPSQRTKPEINTTQLEQTVAWTLLEGLAQGEGFVKVHAAEGLIWNGYPHQARQTFLGELAKDPKPPYRIGVWRVLAQAELTKYEQDKYVGKILSALLDPKGPDRAHAGETLAKLGYSEPLDEIIRLANKEKTDAELRMMANWILANSANPKYEQSLARFLDSSDPEIRAETAYALRWLKQISPQTRAKLTNIVQQMPNAEEHVYCLSALYVHSQPPASEQLKSKLLHYAQNGTPAQKSEACHALAKKANINDLPILENLLHDDILDVRCNAANAVLQIQNRHLRQNNEFFLKTQEYLRYYRENPETLIIEE